MKGIENGNRATITDINNVKRTMTLRLDTPPTQQNKGRKSVSNSVTVSFRELGPEQLTLGYAATTHKMQGQSIPRAYCLLGGNLTNQELTYVQVTRAQQETHLFVDRDHAGRQLADLEAAMKRSGKKQMAHELSQNLQLRIERSLDESNGESAAGNQVRKP